MHNHKSSLNGFKALWFACCLALSTLSHAAGPAKQAQPFEWKSSEPLIRPPADAKNIFGVKDPTIVYHDGRYHVFMTTAGTAGWGMAYT
ncbi:hypothetical protein, partial [Roseateles sp. P5_E7]